jgi:hypothetical protein
MKIFDSEDDVPAVPAPPTGVPLLDELDHRQDEVLRQLEELNGQIEQLVSQWQQGSGRSSRAA